VRATGIEVEVEEFEPPINFSPVWPWQSVCLRCGLSPLPLFCCALRLLLLALSNELPSSAAPCYERNFSNRSSHRGLAAGARAPEDAWNLALKSGPVRIIAFFSCS
jgi:hypothetical protein